MRDPIALALVLVLVTAPLAPVATAATAQTPAGPEDTPELVAAYPNPIASGDAGEYALLRIPDPAVADRYELADGEANVSLANVTTEGRVALASDPDAAADHVDAPVVAAPDLSLANGGEHLRVAHRESGAVVGRGVYRDAPEGEVVTWNGTRVAWRSLGATDRPVVEAGPATVRAFTLPDAPAVPGNALADADRRLLLGGYTLTSDRVADALVRAERRNATVRVLLEGDPVGGRTRREARLLDRLVEAGVEVRVLGGARARYDFHHAKYAVVDDRALVTTENWKPAGTGGNASRGWGVLTEQPAVVSGLAETFRADAGWRDARPWEQFRRGRSFQRQEAAVAEYPEAFDSERLSVSRTELLVAPDNAGPRLVGHLDRANDSVDVVQMSLGDWDEPLPRALRRAADRGVRVRLLLSSAWYVREENRETATRFREWAETRDAPLEVRLAEPGDRYEKIHAKGAILDGERVVVGSLNWNHAAATNNRETVLVLHGEAVAEYFGRVFDADWRGETRRFPVGLGGALAALAVLAGLVARRMEFER